jgi:hypothetical protein
VSFAKTNEFTNTVSGTLTETDTRTLTNATLLPGYTGSSSFSISLTTTDDYSKTLSSAAPNNDPLDLGFSDTNYYQSYNYRGDKIDTRFQFALTPGPNGLEFNDPPTTPLGGGPSLLMGNGSGMQDPQDGPIGGQVGAVGVAVPLEVQLKHMDKDEFSDEDGKSSLLKSWRVGGFKHEVRRVGNFYEYQIYDCNPIPFLGIFSWGTEFELIHRERFYIQPGEIPELVMEQIRLASLRETLATAAMQTELSANRAGTVLIIIASIGVPGPEDVVVGVGRSLGYQLIKDMPGGVWRIFRGNTELTGQAAETAVHEITKEVAKRLAPKGAGLLEIPAKGLQKVFDKHGANFGLSGNWSSGRAADVLNAIKNHMGAAGTRIVEGTYRGQKVFHYVDSTTGLNVITDLNGKFIGGWKLGLEQLESVLTTGRLY